VVVADEGDGGGEAFEAIRPLSEMSAEGRVRGEDRSEESQLRGWEEVGVPNGDFAVEDAAYDG
jgi:hypothetical protein